MGVLTDGFMTVVSLTRELDGRIWDYETQTWLPPNTDTEMAADEAINESISAILDLLPFPFAINVMGLFTVNVDRPKMDETMSRVQTAIKNYVLATRNQGQPVP